MSQARQQNADATWLLVEPWQQLLMLQSVIQYSTEEGAVTLKADEGKAAFLEACLGINDLTIPRASRRRVTRCRTG